MTVMRWRNLGAALLCLGLFAGTASAQSSPYVLIVAGASGEEQYAKMHRASVDALVAVLKDKFGVDASRLTVLTEAPKAGESAANAVNVKAALTKMAPLVTKDDIFFVMLLGHGSGSGPESKFNLIGPDLTAAEWNELLKPVAGRVAFVNASSASVGFVKTLAAPDRVIVTATSTPAQVYHPRFGQAFVEALTAAEADLDKNTRVSVWEAFVFASKTVEQHYKREGTLATEKAMLDDTGTGTGRDAAAVATTATLSSLTYLDAPKVQKSADPAVQLLIDKREALTRQIDDLRRRQVGMPAAEFEQQFEKLALELATVSAEIRKKQP